MTKTHEATDWLQVKAALAAPFPSYIIRWKAKDYDALTGRAKALAYITARDVMNRLDEAAGLENWSDAYRVVFGADGTRFGVECTLTVSGISKTGVGYAEDAGGARSPHDGDNHTLKAAYSDALKRAAVKFGIARYLYALPTQWVEYDGSKFVRLPVLPIWAAPGGDVQAPENKAPLPTPPSERMKVEETTVGKTTPGEMTPAQARALILPLGTRNHPEWKGRTLGELHAQNAELIAYLAGDTYNPSSVAARQIKQAARVLAQAA